MQRSSFLSPLRVVNLLKLLPPARGYGPPCCYEPLRSGPVVEPAGMTSSVPCREPVFEPSRHHGASYTMATWLLRDRKPAQVADWGEGVGRGGGGGGGGGWKTESEGEINSLTRMRERLEGWRMGGGGGGGLIGGGDKLDFWSRLTTHISLNGT